jgi:hypothetical protein
MKDAIPTGNIRRMPLRREMTMVSSTACSVRPPELKGN